MGSHQKNVMMKRGVHHILQELSFKSHQPPPPPPTPPHKKWTFLFLFLFCVRIVMATLFRLWRMLSLRSCHAPILFKNERPICKSITYPDLIVVVTPQIIKGMTLQIVLISGCSSGIGLATAVLLAKDAEKRFKVYATMRNLAKKGQLEEEGKEQLGLSNRWTCAVFNQSRRLLKRCSTLKGKSMCCVSGSRLW